MRYTKLTVIIKPNSKLPYFIGSQIRGAFGYGLKKLRVLIQLTLVMDVLLHQIVYIINFMKKKTHIINID